MAHRSEKGWDRCGIGNGMSQRSGKADRDEDTLWLGMVQTCAGCSQIPPDNRRDLLAARGGWDGDWHHSILRTLPSLPRHREGP